MISLRSRFEFDVRDGRFHLDGAETIDRAFLDRHRNDERIALGVVVHLGGDDAEVRIALVEVEAADEFEVGVDAVGVVDVRGLQPAHEVRFRRRHLVAETAVGKRFVADEFDLGNLALRIFVDDEDEVDAAVGTRNHLRLDGRVVAAGTAIEFKNALDVALHQSLAERTARFRLNFGLERRVLDLACCLRNSPG